VERLVRTPEEEDGQATAHRRSDAEAGNSTV
jgi:hypothetical protein